MMFTCNRIVRQKLKTIVKPTLMLKRAAAITVAIAILSLFSACGSKQKDFDRFKDSAGTLLQRTAELAKKARTFNQAKALKGLNKLPFNGFYYRFDDHLGQAQVDGGPAKEAGNPYLVNFEFDGKDALAFRSEKETYSIDPAGILKIKHVPDAYFDIPVNLPSNRVGVIEIRAKHRRGKLMRLGLNRNIKRRPTWREHFADHFSVIPDNRFHVYTMDAKQLMESRFKSVKNLENFYLFVSDRDGDDVKIDYIRIISKKANYLREPFGSAYETKKGETRRVLYSQTPLSLTYRVKIPAAESTLRFGMGVIDDTDPVTFSILAGNKREIFSRQVKSAAGWFDARISMKPYAGEKVTLTFRAESRKGNIALWSSPVLYRPPKERFNIIIVLEDALRAGSMSCYGYHRDTTPVKKKFAEKGVFFENAFSQAPTTRPSCASLMTSLFPTTTKLYLLENYLTLAEILRYAGFRTAAFIQNPHSGIFAGLHQGFSYLYNQFHRSDASRDLYGKEALTWIKEQGDMNYFLYLHVIDPHAPYNPPEEFRRRYNEVKPGKQEVPRNPRLDPSWVTQPSRQGRKARYEGEIENNDFHFQTFLDGLEKLKTANSTLLVFIADHGEFLGEHDLWTHLPPCYTQVIKTPMIMVCPEKLPQNRIVSQPVQNLDILPTILELTGISRDNLLLAGDSLLPLIGGQEADYWDNRIILSDEMANVTGNKAQNRFASLIFGDAHIINSRKVPMRQFAYPRDRDELNGISVTGAKKEFYESFIMDLHKNNMLIWQAITKKKTRREKYDQKTLKRLRSLGYVE